MVSSVPYSRVLDYRRSVLRAQSMSDDTLIFSEASISSTVTPGTRGWGLGWLSRRFVQSTMSFIHCCRCLAASNQTAAITGLNLALLAASRSHHSRRCRSCVALALGCWQECHLQDYACPFSPSSPIAAHRHCIKSSDLSVPFSIRVSLRCRSLRTRIRRRL